MGWTTSCTGAICTTAGCGANTIDCAGTICTTACSSKIMPCSSGSAKGGGGGMSKPASTASCIKCRYAGSCGVRGFSGSLSSKSKMC